ncbi:MAG: glycosyltransferase family 4 protein [Gammaproteobacteria bacterium]
MYGGAVQVINLVAGLADRGVRGTLVCAEGGLVAVAAQARGIDVLPVPMGGDLDVGFVVRLTRIIRRLKPTVVHVHSRRGADWFGGLAARLAGVPAVLSRRVDSQESIAGRPKYRLYRRVIAISGCIRSQLLAAGVPDDKVRLVRSGVATVADAPAWPRERFLREFGLDDDAFVIGMIAQLISRKGHEYLLDALPAIHAAYTGTRALLFGAGALEARLAALAEQKQLGDVVRLAGFRHDLAEFLGHLDVIVHPATREGLGVSVLEAQAAGVPVVAFRAGGVAEAVNDGVTGKLVSPRDVAGLERALTHLAWHPQERAKMGAAAREWVADQFGIDAMINGNLAVYRELTGTT